MTTEVYQKPDLKWLKNLFQDIKIGWLKASEMEIYLAYMLMYANNDLGRVAYEIADEYGYTESKVAKLQVEFARRFKTKEKDDVFLTRIFKAMTKKNESLRIVPIIKNDAISFTLYDAGDARRLRNIICRTGMMAISDSSKLVFNLTPEVFAALFVDCSEEFKQRLDTSLHENTETESLKKIFLLPREKMIEKVKTIGLWFAEKSMTAVISSTIGTFFKQH